MTYDTITIEQFLIEARAWAKKRRAMRRAAFFNTVFDAFMSIFSVVFLALTCAILAAPFLLAIAAFLGIPPH